MSDHIHCSEKLFYCVHVKYFTRVCLYHDLTLMILWNSFQKFLSTVGKLCCTSHLSIDDGCDTNSPSCDNSTQCLSSDSTKNSHKTQANDVDEVLSLPKIESKVCCIENVLLKKMAKDEMDSVISVEWKKVAIILDEILFAICSFVCIMINISFLCLTVITWDK